MGKLLHQIKATWDAYVKKDYVKAIEMFENVIAAGEKNPGTYTSLAYCYKELNNLDSALKHCKDALDLDPNHYEALKLISLIYEAMQKHDEAYEYVKRALANQNKTLTEPPEVVIKFSKKLSRFTKYQDIEKDIRDDWPPEEEVKWQAWANDFIEQYEAGLYKKNIT